MKRKFTPNSISDVAKLYGIIDKLGKKKRKVLSKPLSLYRYIGTLTSKSLEDRFKEHCIPKTGKWAKDKFVFNANDHCIVPIMEFSKEHLDERFDTPNEAAVAFEIFSTV